MLALNELPDAKCLAPSDKRRGEICALPARSAACYCSKKHHYGTVHVLGVSGMPIPACRAHAAMGVE